LRDEAAQRLRAAQASCAPSPGLASPRSGFFDGIIGAFTDFFRALGEGLFGPSVSTCDTPAARSATRLAEWSRSTDVARVRTELASRPP